ncbi:diguanylate cyclase [Jannaschia sp. Os4]|uniref:diguanylate cyclase n=1 Tax=Jannaschia sp. Os4 TaxID=2807617 RepID=UPI00193A0081|nr:diguanylate cyclase [Jannaschia sp. Os4]MBM2577066.1 diguanylate cyclase [Jannaschia sp. Os4]
MTGRILVVDDVATNRAILKVKLTAARYDVLMAASGAEALEVAAAEQPDIVILDMVMPGLSGADTCRALRADPALASIPVIIVTASPEADARIDGLSAGADDYLCKPVEEVALLARVRSLLRARGEEREYESRGALFGWDAVEAPRPMGFGERGQAAFASPAPAEPEGRIALIAPPTAAAEGLRRALGQRFRGGVAALDPDAALDLAPETMPDVVVIDDDAAQPGTGLRLMSEMRARPASRHAAYVALLPEAGGERAATALDLGAADAVARDVPPDELAARIRTHLARKLRGDRMRRNLDTGLQMAVTDPLTGLHNRRYALAHLRRVAERCRREGGRVGVAMVDIDHFKAVNDRWGHAAGDLVLTRVAQVMRLNLRTEDLVARLGGEEFLVILPDTDAEATRAVAERLRRAVEASAIALEDGVEVRVTLSLGTAVMDDAGEDAALRVADRALYSAKEGGRNRVAHIT